MVSTKGEKAVKRVCSIFPELSPLLPPLPAFLPPVGHRSGVSMAWGWEGGDVFKNAEFAVRRRHHNFFLITQCHEMEKGRSGILF
ncbi:MAG: hypothetical protein ACI8PB_003855 [Desulforhopalus sp.]|jgi:hypothetical protein